VIDQGKDVAHPGMFAKTFAERGQKVKVLDMHRRDSIMRVLGKPLELRELSREALPRGVLQEHPQATGGAYARVQFLMDTPEGKGAFIRLREGVVDEWSYGYDALDYDHETIKGTDGQDVTVRNLRTVKLYELGPVLWGMVPGTQTVSAKAEPSEGKPVETTENYVRVRVRDPGLFEEGSFRTITISAKEGIKAVIGRLKGETSTTIQTYLFDKEKWTVARAKKWVKDHKKDWEGSIEIKVISLNQRITRIRNAFDNQFNPQSEPSVVGLRKWWVDEVFEGYLLTERAEKGDGADSPEYPYYRVAYQESEAAIIFAPQAEWIGGNCVFVVGAKSAPDGGPRFHMSEQSDVLTEAGPTTPTSKEQRLRTLGHKLELALLEVQDADDFGETG